MMSISEIAGRAPRASRFAKIKEALSRQLKDLRRARRRAAAMRHPTLHRDAPRGALQAGIEPLRLLQMLLDHADLIALDLPERHYVRNAHLLVTVPVTLLERATVIASYDVDDEDTDGTEHDQDLEDQFADQEPSLGACDGIVNQSKWGHENHQWEGGFSDSDLEFDPADREQSLAGTEAIDQRFIAQGDMRDLEEQCEDEGSDALVSA